MAHTRRIVDSSLVKVKNEIIEMNTAAKDELKRGVQLLRDEIELLKKK